MKIGFMGLGMVAWVFGGAMLESGKTDGIAGYDVRYAENPDMFRRRFEGMNVAFAGSPEELARECDVICSTVTTDVAVDAAGSIAPYLRADQYYVDFNSMTPGRKEEVWKTVGDKCRFVEASVLGAVGATGKKTKILLGGDYAEDAEALLCGLGLNAHFFSREIGRASMFKMVRSVFSKGLETLIIEMMEAAERAGIYEEVWDDICSFMEQKPFRQIGENWVCSHATAATRRYAEMLQVAETLEELGVKPVLTNASAEVFSRSAERKIEKDFEKQPSDPKTVIRYLLDGDQRPI